MWLGSSSHLPFGVATGFPVFYRTVSAPIIDSAGLLFKGIWSLLRSEEENDGQ